METCSESLVMYWRFIIITACGFILLASMWRYWQTRKNMSPEMKLLVHGIWWLIAGTGLRSVEALQHHEQVAWALIPFTIGVLIMALWILQPLRQVRRQLEAEAFPPGPDLSS